MNDGERLDHLLVSLRDPDDIDAAIHETRKGVKRLRAHLRLMRSAIDRPVFSSEDGDLRSIGRTLAPARDAFVLGQTFEGLESSEGWGPAGDLIEAYHRDAVDELLAGPIEGVLRGLAVVRERWPGAGELDGAAVASGLASTYERGRAEHAAAADGHARDFHQWRKRVKYLRYQLEALGADAVLVTTLTELGERLGLEHDHTVFIEFCDDHIDLLPDRRDRYVLIDRAERRRDELRAAAVASDAYAEETDSFVASVLDH